MSPESSHIFNIISSTDVQKHRDADWQRDRQTDRQRGKQQTNVESCWFSRLGVLHTLESTPLSAVLRFTRRSYLCTLGVSDTVCDVRWTSSLPVYMITLHWLKCYCYCYYYQPLLRNITTTSDMLGIITSTGYFSDITRGQPESASIGISEEMKTLIVTNISLLTHFYASS